MILIAWLCYCGFCSKSNNIFTSQNVLPGNKFINAAGNNVETRFLLPAKAARVSHDKNTFADYLSRLPLKKNGAPVFLYNGNLKANQDAHIAVVDMEIGNKNLQQCADAVIRLRAEYLLSTKQIEKISFNFTNGFVCNYSKWQQGYRVLVKGNHCLWQLQNKVDSSYSCFLQYMELVFSYAGTLSLSKEMKPKSIKKINAGDVFIKGGSPGHAVIVVDVAQDKKSGNRYFLLAQSYMPAQEIQVLKNPKNNNLSPWYSVVELINDVETPEWTFTINDLKTFD
jgi:hypothetical protein